MSRGIVTVVGLGMLAVAGYHFLARSRGDQANGVAHAAPSAGTSLPASTPAPVSPQANGSDAVAAAVSHATDSNPDPMGADLSLDENGGRVERVTGEYGAGLDGRRLIDGQSQPTWSWRGSALRDLPLEISC